MGTITDEARQSAIARFWASAATWPVEKSKLIYQGRRQDRTLNPNLSMMKENAGNKKEWAQTTSGLVGTKPLRILVFHHLFVMSRSVLFHCQ